MNATITKKLSNGFTVLAKQIGGKLVSMAYANRTGAEKSAAKIGPHAQAWQVGSCFYVIVEIAI